MSDEIDARMTAIEDRLEAIEEKLGVALTVLGAIGTTAQTVLLTHDL